MEDARDEKDFAAGEAGDGGVVAVPVFGEGKGVFGEFAHGCRSPWVSVAESVSAGGRADINEVLSLEKKQVSPQRCASVGMTGLRNEKYFLLVVVVAFFDEGGGADDVEGDGIAAGGLERGADGEALPFGGRADRTGVVGLGPSADGALGNGFAAAGFRDNSDEAADAFGSGGFAGGGNGAAIGGVVAEPDRV